MNFQNRARIFIGYTYECALYVYIVMYKTHIIMSVALITSPYDLLWGTLKKRRRCRLRVFYCTRTFNSRDKRVCWTRIIRFQARFYYSFFWVSLGTANDVILLMGRKHAKIHHPYMNVNCFNNIFLIIVHNIFFKLSFHYL